MDENGSEQLVSQDQQFYENIVKIFVPAIFSGPIIVLTVGGMAIFIILTMVFIILSPMLIILSPVWIPASFVFWICLYIRGEDPLGADFMDEALERIFEVAEEVKNKVKQLGHA